MSLAPPPAGTAPEDSGPASHPGRGLVIAGGVLLALSVLVGVVGTALTLGRFDLASLQRDVVITGPETALVPGSVEFRVDEPLDPDDTAAMTVGVAVDVADASVECTVTSASGEDQRLRGNPYDAELIQDPEGDYTVIETARLDPGTYTAACEVPGEPSRVQGVNFTVGRTIGADDIGQFLWPALGFGLVLVLSGLMFVVGVILSAVGLVRGNRAGRAQPDHQRFTAR